MWCVYLELFHACKFHYNTCSTFSLEELCCIASPFITRSFRLLDWKKKIYIRSALNARGVECFRARNVTFLCRRWTNKCSFFFSFKCVIWVLFTHFYFFTSFLRILIFGSFNQNFYSILDFYKRGRRQKFVLTFYSVIKSIQVDCKAFNSIKKKTPQIEDNFID